MRRKQIWIVLSLLWINTRQFAEIVLVQQLHKIHLYQVTGNRLYHLCSLFYNSVDMKAFEVENLSDLNRQCFKSCNHNIYIYVITSLA